MMMSNKCLDLPPELLTEILLRLPVKTLLRFSCVCKSWRYLISHDSYFATSHFQQAVSPTNRILFVQSFHSPEALSIDFDASLNDHSVYASLNLYDFLPNVAIIGSCRGFLLLKTHRGFCLWNPSTSVHKQIPDSPITISKNRNIEFPYGLVYELFGFAYEPTTDDYIVVLVSYEGYNAMETHPVSGSIDLEIFSLRANKWKQIEVDFHFPYMIGDTNKYSRLRVGLFLNDAIHWLVHNHETERDVIIAFSLKEMRMSEITLPDDFGVSYSSCFEYHLLVIDRLINAWIVDKETVKIWVMQEYAVPSSWTKTLGFCIHPIPYYCFSPICYTNSGYIVGTDHRGGLVKLNDGGHKLQHHTYSNRFTKRSQMAVYTESLLSLPGGTEQA